MSSHTLSLHPAASSYAVPTGIAFAPTAMRIWDNVREWTVRSTLRNPHVTLSGLRQRREATRCGRTGFRTSVMGHVCDELAEAGDEIRIAVSREARSRKRYRLHHESGRNGRLGWDSRAAHRGSRGHSVRSRGSK